MKYKKSYKQLMRFSDNAILINVKNKVQLSMKNKKGRLEFFQTFRNKNI